METIEDMLLSLDPVEDDGAEVSNDDAMDEADVRQARRETLGRTRDERRRASIFAGDVTGHDEKWGDE